MNFVITLTKPNNTISYLSSSRRGTFTDVLNDAARFESVENIIHTIGQMVTWKDLERAAGGKVGYASVQTVIVESFELVAPKAKPGFIIRTVAYDGKYEYSRAPRKPKELDFGHVHYLKTPNIDKATRFATREEAMKRVIDSRRVLQETVDRCKFGTSTYQDILDCFNPEIIEV